MRKMKIEYRVLGMFQTNTYFLINEETQETIIVDPADSAEYIAKQCELRGYKITAIIFTHGHFDHIYASKQLRELTGAKIYAFEGEKRLLTDDDLNRSKVWASSYTVDVDEYLKEDVEYELAGLKFRIIATPGHTEGSCCLYFEEEKTLMSGDTLFCETYGRTDLPTGSFPALITSLREKVFKLPKETRVYPGHDKLTTIENEILYNPASR